MLHRARESLSELDGRGAMDGAESIFPGLESEGRMPEDGSRFPVSALG